MVYKTEKSVLYIFIFAAMLIAGLLFGSVVDVSEVFAQEGDQKISHTSPLNGNVATSSFMYQTFTVATSENYNPTAISIRNIATGVSLDWDIMEVDGSGFPDTTTIFCGGTSTTQLDQAASPQIVYLDTTGQGCSVLNEQTQYAFRIDDPSGTFSPSCTANSFEGGAGYLNTVNNDIDCDGAGSGGAGSGNDDYAFRIYGQDTPTTSTGASLSELDLADDVVIISEYRESQTGSDSTHSHNFTRMNQEFTSPCTCYVDALNIPIKLNGDFDENDFFTVGIHESTGGEPETKILSVGSVDLDNFPVGEWLEIPMSLRPNYVLKASSTYSMQLIHAGEANANIEWLYGIGADNAATTYDDEHAQVWNGSSWETPGSYGNDVYFEHQLLGFEFQEEQAPGEPAQDEDEPVADGGYSYDYAWINQYQGSQLDYEFTGLSEETIFLVRRIDEEGEPGATLGAYSVGSSTVSSDSFTHSTVSQNEGPFDVFDSTNSQRLIKHHLLEEPGINLYDNEDHRCNTFCAIAHGNIAYSDVQEGHLHDTTETETIDLSQVTYGDHTFIHYAYNGATSTLDERFISISNANTGQEVINVSLETIMNYNGYDNGNGLFGIVTYNTNFMVLNTNGTNLGFVQNLDLADEWWSKNLPEGAYSYAIIDDNNVTISEGEGVILVTAEDERNWQFDNIPNQQGLGDSSTIRFIQNSEDIFTVYNAIDIAPESTLALTGIEIEDVAETYQSNQSLTFTQPDDVSFSLPQTIPIRATINAPVLPYTDDSESYNFALNFEYQLTEECNILCTIEEFIGQENLMIASFVVMLLTAIGFTKVSPMVVLFALAIELAFFGVQAWLPTAFIFSAVILIGALAVIIIVIRNGDD